GTLRIETVDGSNDPTGTLADANATATFSEASLSTSLSDLTITFATEFNLSAGTYALVITTDRAFSETDYIELGADTSSPSYAGGEAKTYDGSTWTSVAADLIFNLKAPGTTFREPAVVGAWSLGIRDVAVRYDDGAGSNADTQTTARNETGVTADITLVTELA
ncbi:MAG: hypothetical protein AAFQ07_09500, partial [Chloroflexota bacterium]